MEHLADDFWHVRGDFRIAHIINVGTQMSLVRRPGGTFVLLDSYEPDKADHDALMALTDGGSLIEAVLNVHPFHTVHCAFVQAMLPNARLIGTRRHHHHLPDLRWDPALIEAPATQRAFADLFDFSVPAGVDFISDDENVHVGSVVVRHRASRIVHADDTLNVLDLPSLIQKLVPGPGLRFHPKLAEALEKRAGAADDYIGWAKDLARDWADTRTVCAAHNGICHLTDQSFADAIDAALDDAAETLRDHRETHG
ncbi:MAG: hypothetical protein B7Y45_01700 [Sphingomonas sp. 28-66-16]|nr:MAG: hypothetical protein B7Y45_01700 [Sphingomonas sp. 28-66-16]